jgi:hypothetical protein
MKLAQFGADGGDSKGREEYRGWELFRAESRTLGDKFDVAIELGHATPFPVTGIVLVCARAMAQRTVEGVVRGAEHDAYVPSPYDQITGMGMVDEEKGIDAAIQVQRISVRVCETGLRIDDMHQVRTV